MQLFTNTESHIYTYMVPQIKNICNAIFYCIRSEKTSNWFPLGSIQNNSDFVCCIPVKHDL